jgi:hypothetical protein
MSVSNGMTANSTTFNNAFASRTGNTSLVGVVTLSNTTESTDKDTGALVVEGGVGVEKSVTVGEDLTVVGDVSVTGQIGAVTGSRASPTAITAAGGITAGTQWEQIQFIEGDGGAIDVTANPQVSAGSTVGQRLKLVGRSDTNTVLLENGTGLALNGDWLGTESAIIVLLWDGTEWVEEYRNEMA